MKTIHLIRHAKSSWKDASLADIDRPLNKRGKKSCKVMAPAILSEGCKFENVFCSPANRALETIERISDQIPDLDIKWQMDESLYTFDSDELFLWCTYLPERFKEIVLIGHNPAFTDFCNELCGENIINIPTCAYVRMESVKTLKWKDINTLQFQLSCFIKPKALSSFNDG